MARSSCFVSAAPRLQALCGKGLCLSSCTSLLSATNTGVQRARGEQGRDGGPAREEGLGSAPPAAPPPLPLQTPPHAGRFPPCGRRKSPAALPCPRGAFSGAPAPSASAIRTWPSPQDSQCASGQTYWRQPTTIRVLASPVASNPNFLPLNLRSAASLQTLLRLACLSRPANGGPVYYLLAGSRQEMLLQWLPRATRDAGCQGLLCSRLGPTGWSRSAGRGARGRGRLAPARGRLRRCGGGGFEEKGSRGRKVGREMVLVRETSVLANVEEQIRFKTHTPPPPLRPFQASGLLPP